MEMMSKLLFFYTINSIKNSWVTWETTFLFMSVNFPSIWGCPSPEYCRLTYSLINVWWILHVLLVRKSSFTCYLFVQVIYYVKPKFFVWKYKESIGRNIINESCLSIWSRSLTRTCPNVIYITYALHVKWNRVQMAKWKQIRF